MFLFVVRKGGKGNRGKGERRGEREREEERKGKEEKESCSVISRRAKRSYLTLEASRKLLLRL